MSIIDVSIFPPHHRKNIKALLYDMEEASEFHSKKYINLMKIHSLTHSTASQVDQKTFEVVEAYRNMLDAINCYTSYIKDNRLGGYLNA